LKRCASWCSVEEVPSSTDQGSELYGLSIKRFNVSMSIKTKGIELDVYDGAGAQLGDLVINKRGLIWCKERTTPARGVHATWKQFIEWMEGS